MASGARAVYASATGSSCAGHWLPKTLCPYLPLMPDAQLQNLWPTLVGVAGSTPLSGDAYQRWPLQRCPLPIHCQEKLTKVIVRIRRTGNRFHIRRLIRRTRTKINLVKPPVNKRLCMKWGYLLKKDRRTGGWGLHYQCLSSNSSGSMIPRQVSGGIKQEPSLASGG